MKTLAPNTMVQNRYLVVQAIGKGGMGEVYLAVDQRLGSAVALKRTFFKDDNALGSAFEREARILARLRHPVLPKVIDHFGEGSDQFLVMEHISGDDLSKRLETANKPFPLSWVMFWADQMLDALSYLHSHEPPIIHRDIKPQNLKLTDDNHIVLLDFGLSKDFDTSTTGNPLNSASVAGYSPHFASMEQIRGTGTDSRSDIYSLSATLYQLLTNTIPIDALSRADALLGGKKDPIVPINEINSEVTPAISEVILKGVELRQEQRFSTAAEMQKALRRAFNQERGGRETPSTALPGASASSGSTNAPTVDTGASEMATRTLGESTGSLDATLQMSSPPGLDEAKQADVKTAVISIPEPAVPETPSPEPEPASSAPEIETVIQAAAAGAAAAPPTRIAEQAPPAKAANLSSASTAAVKTPSKGKGGMIIGVLIGFIVLAAIAGVGGWYGYTKYSTAAKPTPTTAPTVAPSQAPSPAGTVVAETNGETNSNSAVKGDNTTETDVTKSPQTPSNPGTVQTKPTPGQPAKTAGQPTKPTTPKAPQKPKGDDRTVILQ